MKPQRGKMRIGSLVEIKNLPGTYYTLAAVSEPDAKGDVYWKTAEGVELREDSIIEVIRKAWMVFRIGGNTPAHRHPNIKLAEEEAKRISLKHPGSEVLILEIVGSFSTKHEVLSKKIV